MKALEFADFAFKIEKDSNPFFVMATLRGICEDLIVFTFLEKLDSDVREETIRLLSAKNLDNSLRAQTEFFSAVRPWQPVLGPGKGYDKERLIEISSALGWKKKGSDWPTVWFMAERSGLGPLYKYLYSATSRLVHFSPEVLLRMGWGGGADDCDDNTEWRFSTEHFSGYYLDFSRIYSLYVLVLLLRGPAKELLTRDGMAALDAIHAELENALRWPETTTYEEMNAKGPGEPYRIFLRMLWRAKQNTSQTAPD